MRGFLESRKLQEPQAAEKKAAEGAAEAGVESPYGKERNAVSAELMTTETDAKDAEAAVAKTEAFAASEGEGIDAETRKEIEAAKAEMTGAAEDLEAVKTKLAEVDAEAPAEAGAAEAPVAEAPAEAAAAEETPEAPAETAETQEITNEQAVELANKMESLSKNLHDAKTAEEVETAFQAIADQIDQMKGIKFPDKIVSEQGEIDEGGKEIEDDIKSGKALESFKFSRDIKLESLKGAQESAEAMAGKPAETEENPEARFDKIKESILSTGLTNIDQAAEIPKEWKGALKEELQSAITSMKRADYPKGMAEKIDSITITNLAHPEYAQLEDETRLAQDDFWLAKAFVEGKVSWAGEKMTVSQLPDRLRIYIMHADPQFVHKTSIVNKFIIDLTKQKVLPMLEARQKETRTSLTAKSQELSGDARLQTASRKWHEIKSRVKMDFVNSPK